MSRLEDRYKSVVHELIQRTLTLEKWRRDTTGDSPLFDIANEHTPVTLSANQNDYDIGWYDVLRLSSAGYVTITGFQKGKKGRVLRVLNVGAYPIALADESALSSAANRFQFATNTTNIIMPGSSISLYYDSTQARWVEGLQLEESNIAKETTQTIEVNQNDYDPSDYGVLRLNAIGNVTISGMQGGIRGRFLEVINVGTGRLSFSNEDTGSSAANRIATPYQETVTLIQYSRARFYYDATIERWTLADSPNITGLYGKTCEVWNNGANVSIPNAAETLLIPTTVVTDEWGFYNSTNGRFSVPADETGSIYAACISVSWSSVIGAGTLRQIGAVRNGTAYSNRFGVPSLSAIATNMTVTLFINLWSSSYIEFYVRQDSGGNLNLFLNSIVFGKVI